MGVDDLSGKFLWKTTLAQKSIRMFKMEFPLKISCFTRGIIVNVTHSHRRHRQS